MNRVKLALTNKKGSFSMLFVILCFVGVLLISGFIDILFKTYSINEVQGIMDNAGVSALRAGVNETKWRVEELEINETVVKNKFHELVNKSLSRSGAVVDYEMRPKVIPPNSPELKKLGIPNGERDQYFLVAEARVKYDSDPMIDTVAFASLKYYNFFNKRGEEIRYEGVTEDGYAEVVVRSVSRLVLR